MWLIRLGKVTSVLYLVLAYIFAFFHFLFLLGDPDKNKPQAAEGTILVLMIPMSFLIPWAARRLQKRLFEDYAFQRRDWIYYPGIIVGSWLSYIGLLFALGLLLRQR